MKIIITRWGSRRRLRGQIRCCCLRLLASHLPNAACRHRLPRYRIGRARFWRVLDGGRLFCRSAPFLTVNEDRFPPPVGYLLRTTLYHFYLLETRWRRPSACGFPSAPVSSAIFFTHRTPRMSLTRTHRRPRHISTFPPQAAKTTENTKRCRHCWLPLRVLIPPLERRQRRQCWGGGGAGRK